MKGKKANLCGKQVKLARIDREMHQVELAAALSVDYGIEMNQSIVSAIERGLRRVSDIELDALARVLRKPVVWLLYGDKGEPKR
jgi:HTH-type transcriptional regulator, cell division transcriptional repressor